jgi:hypothetical protein
MSTSVKKRSAPSSAAAGAATKPPQQATVDPKAKNTQPGSKQSRVIAMLQSPAGATITAMMQATGWQQHSVRSFLAGIVRKKLKLNLDSKKIDGSRFYRIKGADCITASGRQSKRRAA